MPVLQSTLWRGHTCMNEWSYTSTTPTCLHGMNWGNLSDIRPWWDYITSPFAAFHITFKHSPTIRYWTSGDIIPCSLVDAYQCLGGIHCLHGFSLLKTEGAGKVIPIYQLQSITYQPRTLTCNAVAYRGGGFGVFNGLGCSTTPPRNSEGRPKLCQTQPNCENC